ncbi:hypothetical protein ACQ4PT_057264 [Festuca glaucescens]
MPSNRDVPIFPLSGRPLREAVPFAGFAPVLTLPFHTDGTISFYRPTGGDTFERNLSALRGKVVCGSSRGWVALVDMAANMKLLNLFTGATSNLPPANNRLLEAYFRRVSMHFDRYRGILHYQRRAIGAARRQARLDEDVLFREIMLSS